MEAKISWNPTKSKYELKAKGKVLVRSNRIDYLNYLVNQQKHSAIVNAGVKTVAILSRNPAEASVVTLTAPTAIAAPMIQAPAFTINERFSFMDELIDMVIKKAAKSILITGMGGVGKTYAVIQRLKTANLVDCVTVAPSISDLDEIDVEDSEDEMESKALAEMNRPTGDYVVVKGKATPKALYRLLYENRNRMIVFDDCDSVLRDDNSVNLLKSALDTYEDRWISWRSEQAFGESDLPQSFKFNGTIIFISNLEQHAVDEAVRTRCFKVDVSMSNEQRVERMKGVLENVLPDVDMEFKLDAIKLIEDNLHLCNDINFRTLMQIITIRENSADWKKLGKFALTEH